jgi:hypothetical protein
MAGPRSSAQITVVCGGGVVEQAITCALGTKSGSVLVVHDRLPRQRAPSRRIWRTWLRPTRMPSVWARASRVQWAGASGWAGASSPSPPW